VKDNLKLSEEEARANLYDKEAKRKILRYKGLLRAGGMIW
jgi:hypothetical protein